MDEFKKQCIEVLLKVFGISFLKWLADCWLEFRDRQAAYTVLEIPHPAPPTIEKIKKKTTKKRRKRTPTPTSTPATTSSHGRFCPECGHERG